ncbi:MAG: hypothetical protein Q4C98_10140 [Capnocytophaga sp.]|nr:hypothetical protein [Capnocytophaga sp.]
MQNSINAVVNEINSKCIEIVGDFQTLTFQAEVLSGDKLIITATTDVSYKTDFCIELEGVSYMSGHLTWHWDKERNNSAVELVDIADYNLIMQDNCFLIKFNNVDLGIKNLILMAQSIKFGTTCLSF